MSDETRLIRVSEKVAAAVTRHIKNKKPKPSLGSYFEFAVQQQMKSDRTAKRILKTDTSETSHITDELKYKESGI